MATPKRTEILQGIETKLATITIANGYNNTVKKTSYGFIPLSKNTQYPTVSLIPLSSNYAPLTNTEYTSGSDSNTLDGWNVAIIGYVREKHSEEALTQAMEKLIQDIVKAMLDDHTLGLSYVNTVYLVSIDSVVDVDANIGSVEVIIAVKYDFTKSAP